MEQLTETNEEILVENAEGEPNTKATIIHRNNINYEPKVSVIIPVYNVEKYLRECLDSVVNQTLKEIEIICVDDGSTDSSLDILKEYATKDNRFTIITQKNLHAGVARNRGIQLAKGEYVHFLDSDDWIEQDAYEKLYKILKDNKADLVKFKAYSFNNQTGETTSRPYLDIKWVDEKCFNTCLNIIEDTKNTIKLPDSPWSGFYNLDFLKRNNIYFDDFICANDVGFFYRCIINAEKIYLSSEKLVYYRENMKNSLIAKRAENFNCQTALYKVVKNVSKNLPHQNRQIVMDEIIQAVFNWYNKCLKEYTLSIKTEQNIKKEMKKFLKDISKENLSKSNIKHYKNINSRFIEEQRKMQKELIANIFSVRNIEKHKVICILGIKVKVKLEKLIKKK